LEAVQELIWIGCRSEFTVLLFAVGWKREKEAKVIRQQNASSTTRLAAMVCRLMVT
jgi:hypothetical protein